jgi:predicted nuclease of predicted toxin-antitoxin system
MHDAPDIEILDFAAAQSRIVITLDRDFPEILALTAASRPSVVLIRQQRLPGPQVATLLASLSEKHEAALG